MARRSPARPPRLPSRRAGRKAAAVPLPAPPPPSPLPPVRPDVIVDFALEGGLLFVAVQNIGAASAYHVVVEFDCAFRGLGGRKDLSTIALFRSLMFLPPGKRLVQLVDSADAYFQRGEPTRLNATISYVDRDGQRFVELVPHDLEVYRDLAQPMPR